MDQKQIDTYALMTSLRRFYQLNAGNGEALAQHEQVLNKHTIPAPDNAGRVLPQKYEWVIDYSKGFIHVDTTSYIECEILYRGFYAPQLVDLINRLLGPGCVAIDVGANIGCLSLLMAWNVGSSGRVISFEPEPECFSRLKRNVLLNRLTHVSLYELAISDKDEVKTLYLKAEEAANRAGASLERGVGFDREVKIRTARAESVKELGELTRCDLLKIDTEGHELVVLKQLKELLARLHPHIIFEYEKTTWGLHHQSFDEAVEFLSELGYQLYAIDHGMIVPLSPTFPSGRDILCVPPVLRNHS